MCYIICANADADVVHSMLMLMYDANARELSDV